MDPYSSSCRRLYRTGCGTFTDAQNEECGETSQDKLPRLKQQVERLRRPLTLRNRQIAYGLSSSQTHHQHQYINLQPGDVLVHCGDVTGNYGNTDLQAHFQDFLDWLVKVSKLRSCHLDCWQSRNHIGRSRIRFHVGSCADGGHAAVQRHLLGKFRGRSARCTRLGEPGDRVSR